MKLKWKTEKLLGLLFVSAFLSSPSMADPACDQCTQTPQEDTAVQTDTNCQDRFERINRGIFAFNDFLDTILLRPVATFYNKIIPTELNQGIHNFFNNLYTIPTIANDLLQLKFYQMTNDIWRLGINTTIGFGGLVDIAERIHLQPYTNDFGLTLATWGWDNSTYIVLPFWGPKTIRDTIGMPVDYYAFSVWPRIYPTRTRYGLYALSVIDARVQKLNLQNLLDEAAYDKYVFIRNAYMQRRAFEIEENKHRSCADCNNAQSTDLEGEFSSASR